MVAKENIEQKLENLAKAIPTKDELVENVMSRIETKPDYNKNKILVRRFIMNRLTKLTAAAAIIIAVLIGVNHFGGTIDGTAAVWANTLEQIYAATSVSYTRFEEDKANPFYLEEMMNENGVVRTVTRDSIRIAAFREGKVLQLVPSKKEATLAHHIDLMRNLRPCYQLDWLISIRDISKDKAGEFLGTEDINGTLANKFFWQRGEYYNVTVWVDPSTEFPLKVKQVFLPNPDKKPSAIYTKLNLSDFGGDDCPFVVGVLNGDGILEKSITIMKDFIWNQQLDPALFSTKPPEDYTLRVKHHNVPAFGENHLIQALAFWTEMSSGSFPEKINDMVDPNQINPMLIEKFNGDGDPQDEIDEAMKQARIISRGLIFVQRKKAERNWHYAGGGVYLGDPDTMVCWWKQEDTNNYRAIFGDLSIGTVSAEDLPK